MEHLHMGDGHILRIQFSPAAIVGDRYSTLVVVLEDERCTRVPRFLRRSVAVQYLHDLVEHRTRGQGRLAFFVGTA